MRPVTFLICLLTSVHITGCTTHHAPRAEVHNKEGLVFQSHGNPQGAIESYRRALAISPRYAEAHYNLGTVLESQGKFTEAISHFETAVDINPRFTEAKKRLALYGRGELALFSSTEVLDQAVAYLVSLGMPRTYRVHLAGPQKANLITLWIDPVPDTIYESNVQHSWSLQRCDDRLRFDDRQRDRFVQWLQLEIGTQQERERQQRDVTHNISLHQTN
jgi:tetratricopeptide (TPR) repeat protein